MAPGSRVYIAGVGQLDASKKNALVASTAKALLDAGINFDDIDKAVLNSSKENHEALKQFDKHGIDTEEAKRGNELAKGYSLISDGKAACVLVQTSEKSLAVSLVLVSENFLWRHPYLKDSAVSVEQSKSSGGSEGLDKLCQSVFAWRGWTQDKTDNTTKISDASYNLKRADGQDVPRWKDIEHKQDGRDRLGHNPAKETKDLRHGDFESVKADDGNAKKLNSMRSDRAALAKL